MRMKRSVSIMFLLLANVFLLAHAVVPHHHHDSMPVAVLDMHGHHHNHDSHHQDHDSHHHDASHHHDGPETCLISQAEAGAVVRHGDGFSLSAAVAVLTGGWESPLMEGEPVRFAPTVREAVFRPHCAPSLRAPPVPAPITLWPPSSAPPCRSC